MLQVPCRLYYGYRHCYVKTPRSLRLNIRCTDEDPDLHIETLSSAN
jgi:hypothetical protein